MKRIAVVVAALAAIGGGACAVAPVGTATSLHRAQAGNACQDTAYVRQLKPYLMRLRSAFLNVGRAMKSRDRSTFKPAGEAMYRAAGAVIEFQMDAPRTRCSRTMRARRLVGKAARQFELAGIDLIAASYEGVYGPSWNRLQNEFFEGWTAVLAAERLLGLRVFR